MRKRPVREDVRGVTVYGNDEGWEWRTARVHVFIQQGPNGDSKLPTLEELPRWCHQPRNPAGTT